MTDDELAGLAALDGVSSAFAAARDGIDALLRDRGMRRTPPALTAESLLRGAVAAAALEGSDSTAEEVRDGGGDQVARAAVRLSTEVLGLVGTMRTAPLQALARLHAVAAADAAENRALGRPRDPAAAQRLQSLARRLVAPTGAPALLVAAVVHAELAAEEPFGSRDGLVARAAERLVLVARGVDPASLVVPEAGHLALGAAYPSNLRAYSESRARAGDDRGVSAWLRYAAEAYARAAEESPLNHP